MPVVPGAKPRSAGVVIVRSDDAGDWQMLMLRAYRDWDFPKGEIDSGETALEAAVREAAEEASLTALSFDWGYDWCDTAPYSRGKIARYFLARTSGGKVTLGISPVLGRPEHHEYRWVTIAEARILAATRLSPIIEWAVARLHTSTAGPTEGP